MKIKTYKDLAVYNLSFSSGMKIFELTKKFPNDEKYSLTDQIRRSSRSVSANIAEAYGTRRYKKNFVSKLVIAIAEATETQTWLDYALACNYINELQYKNLYDQYDHIIAMLVNMTNQAEKWTL
jgi:four helix bundle protein